METRKIAAEYRLTHWAGIMSERQESELSIKAFCENAGIHEDTYFYWQRKLCEATCNRLSRIGLVQSGFMELKLAEHAATSCISQTTTATSRRHTITTLSVAFLKDTSTTRTRSVFVANIGTMRRRTTTCAQGITTLQQAASRSEIATSAIVQTRSA